MSKAGDKTQRRGAADSAHNSEQTSAPFTLRPVSFGVGVFALRDFEAGDHIADMTGDIIPGEDYVSETAARLADDLSLEPHGPLRELNHHCEANCKLRPSPDRTAVQVFAKRSITAGEQLTIDYGWPADEDCMLCACDSDNCRIWIVAEEELEYWPYLLAWTDWDAAPDALREKFERRLAQINR